MGQTIFEAINGRDYIVIQGFTLRRRDRVRRGQPLVDVSYAFLDPRVRLDERRRRHDCRRRPRPTRSAAADERPASGATRCATSCASAPRWSGWSSSRSCSSSRSSPTSSRRTTRTHVDARHRRRTQPSRAAPPCIHLLGCPRGPVRSTSSGLDGNIRDVFSRVVLRRPGLAAGRVRHRRLRDRHRHAPRRRRGLRRRARRQRAHAARWTCSWPSPACSSRSPIVTVLGPGLFNAQLAIGIVAIPIYARVMRASVLSIREQDFVTASRALGESSRGHPARAGSCPNALTPLIVQGTLGIGGGDPGGRGALVPRARRPAAARPSGAR